MNARKLISLAAALLITGVGVHAMIGSYNSYTRAMTAMDTTTTLPAVTLSTIEVTATPLPPLNEKPNDAGYNHVANDDRSIGDSSALHDTAFSLTLPQLSMPYYSFGSATLQIRKD